jgi:hypothetical protein
VLAHLNLADFLALVLLPPQRLVAKDPTQPTPGQGDRDRYRGDSSQAQPEGLEAGERVAIEGLLRLRNGAVVNPTVVDLASLEPDAKTQPGG